MQRHMPEIQGGTNPARIALSVWTQAMSAMRDIHAMGRSLLSVLFYESQNTPSKQLIEKKTATKIIAMNQSFIREPVRYNYRSDKLLNGNFPLVCLFLESGKRCISKTHEKLFHNFSFGHILLHIFGYRYIFVDIIIYVDMCRYIMSTTNTAIPRLEKAFEMLGNIQIVSESIVLVKSQRGTEIYEVDMGNSTCTCPDHLHRQVTCKHIRTVELQQMKEANEFSENNLIRKDLLLDFDDVEIR